LTKYIDEGEIFIGVEAFVAEGGDISGISPVLEISKGFPLRSIT